MYLLEHRISKSLKIIGQMLELSKTPYLALSFGKDSLVMLDLVRQVKPDIHCLFLKSEESFLMYNYEEVIEQYRSKGVTIEIVETNRLSEHDFNWTKARKAGNKDFLLEPFFRGWDGVFMGLRIQESKARRITLVRKEHNVIGDKIMRYKDGKRKGMLRCCPVSYWTAEEIMLYLDHYKLPRLDVYNQGSNIRTTARLTGDSVRSDGLFWVKQNKPENWNLLLKMIPELKYYK